MGLRIVAYMLACLMGLAAVPVAAQDRYWRDGGDMAREDPFQAGWQYRRNFIYETPGFLPGEAAYVRLSSKMAPDVSLTIDDIVVEVLMAIDVAGTFPDKTIRYFVDIGFCSKTDSGCVDYNWVTQSLEPFSERAYLSVNTGAGYEKRLSVSEVCFADLPTFERNERMENCPLGEKRFISILGRSPMRSFLSRSDSADLSRRKLALRFRGDGDTYEYVTFPAITLIEQLRLFVP